MLEKKITPFATFLSLLIFVVWNGDIIVSTLQLKKIGHRTVYRMVNRRSLSDDRNNSETWPLGVGSCPESGNYSRSYLQNMSVHSLDKFLVLAWLPEQLTKSRKHFAEAMAFSKATNRTLVLPKCESGHIGSGLYHKHSICLYFDLEKIGNFVPWITEDMLLKRLDEKIAKEHSKPMISAVYFKWPGQLCNPLIMFGQTKNEASMGPTNDLFKTTDFICSENCPVNKTLPTPISLLTDKSAKGSDVLVFGKSSPYECFGEKEAMKSLIYPERLNEHVNKFVDAKLGNNFLSIHWRMEMMMWRESTRKSFDKCAIGLIETATQLMGMHNLTGVFMASDVSPDNIIHSTSMGLGEGARKKLVSVVQAVHKALKPQTWKSFDPNVPHMDSGVQGILDKLVCSKGHTFLYAPNICFGYKFDNFIPSSYTREIVDIRNEQGISSNFTHTWKIVSE